MNALLRALQRQQQQLLLLLLLSLALFFPPTLCQSCFQEYDGGQKPLLFGGLMEQGRCKSGCQLKTGTWKFRCSFVSGSAYGGCSSQQYWRAMELAKSLNGGEALRLSPCDLIPFIRGRTLWLVGDSHTKSFYRALQCFLIDAWDNQQQLCETSQDAYAVQELRNLPVRPGESQCLHLSGIGGGRICVVFVVLGDALVNNNNVAMGGVLPLLRAKFAKPYDIFYVSFGTWHKKSQDWWNSFRPALHNLGEYYAATKNQWPYLLFRETPATHSPDSGRTKCLDAQGFVYQPWNGALEVAPNVRITADQAWRLGQTENMIIANILGKYGVPLVAGFNITAALADNHIGTVLSKQLDCLHYCHPGVPEMWIWYLYDALRSGKAGITKLSDPNGGYFPCITSYTTTWNS